MLLQAPACPTRSVPTGTPGSPPVNLKYFRDGESPGRAFNGDRCDRIGAIPAWTRSAPANSGQNFREGGTNSCSEGAVLKWAAGAVAPNTDVEGGSGASLQTPEKTSGTLRLRLSGSFLDGVVPCATALEREAAASKRLKVPSSSSPRQRRTRPLDDGVYGAGQRKAVKKAHVRHLPRNSPFLPSSLKTTAAPSSTEKRGDSSAAVAAAFCSRHTSPGFIVSGYSVLEPAAQHRQAKPEQGLHVRIKEIDRGPEEPRNEASVTGTADDDLSSIQILRVPAAPICKPLSWEGPSDSVARRLAAAPAPGVASEPKSIRPGWTPPAFSGRSGTGTAAAVAAKDVQNLTPTITIPRATIKPCLVSDLVGMISRSPPSPSPPATCGRAFGVISPLFWGAAIGRLLSTPRMETGSGSPCAAATPNSEGGRYFRNNSGVTIAGRGAAFFPVRPSAGRSSYSRAGRNKRCLRAEVK